MELPELGERCSHQNCKQLDFLPFHCTHCKLIFCKEHYMSDNHECTIDDNISSTKVQPTIYDCKYNCKSISPVEMCCPVCKKRFFCHHRRHGCIYKDQEERNKEKVKWDAPQKQFEVAKAEADRQVDTSMTRAKKEDNKTALKVQLMRLKGKAVGVKGILLKDRVYFLVHPPLIVPKRKSQAVFVSKKWSIGQVIDSIAYSCGVMNRNNESNTKELRLFHHDSCNVVCSEMKKKLEQLLNDEIITEGETLKLEYSLQPAVQLDSTEIYKD